MKVSKTKFINYIKCPVYFNLSKADIDTNFNEYEVNEKYKDMLTSITETPDYDKGLIQVETMMPYFKQVEDLAANIAKKYFGGNIHSTGATYGQSKFERKYKSNTYICYVDILSESDKQVDIIEVKATTSKKFMNMTFNKEPIFIKGRDNIIRLRESSNPEFLDNEKYLKQREKLFDFGDGVGKYFYDLAFQCFVSKGSLNKPTNYYLAVLNHEYIFDGEYNDKGEAVYSPDINGNEIITFIDFSPMLQDYEKKIKEDVNRLEDMMAIKEFEKPYLDGRCNDCEYKKVCWKDIPEKNSILAYIGSHHGFKDDTGDKKGQYELLNDGYINLTDIPDSWLKRENNRIQKEVVETGTPYVDKEKIKSSLNMLTYPLYHLDFETFPCPLPRFKGEKPYTQSLFQFSLHIEKEEGICDKERDHYEFLADSHRDLREDFIKAMIEHIDLDSGGKVIVYNQAFEKTRLKEIAEIFGDYRDELEKLNDMIFDLMDIVKTNTKFYKGLGYEDDRAKLFNYYHSDLNGSFSIKKVLPVFTELSYDGLDVNDGIQAMLTYADESILKAKQKELREYCKQDTWAMVEILRELRELINH